MKNRSLPFALLLLFSLHLNCGEDSKNDPLVLALLGRNCMTVPKTVRKHDGVSTISTYQCSASGLVYTCSASGVSYVRTYLSVNSAKLGLIDPPESSMPISQRGLGSYKLITPAGTVGQHYTYTYDSSQRLVSRKNEMSSGVSTFNDYDANGFPENGGAYSYNYATGSARPIGIADGGTVTEYNSKGWVTKEDSGSDTFYESTGTLEICD
ncbi:hypothetical protein [Leptospira sarikeiensis]|nr:hypothetical protein [Leptospira sarikeiensis]